MIEVAREAFEAMTAHAAAAAPLEACGLLLGREGRVLEARPAANVHATPLSHFEIDPAALIAAYKAEREGKERLVGYYHSHPSGPAEPSATDRAMATGDGRVWAIAGEGKITFWKDGEAGFVPLSYRLSAI